MKIRAKGVLNLPYKYTMYNKQGEIIHACPFKFEVELDEIEKFNNVRLILKPLDPSVVITRHYYLYDESEIDPNDFERIPAYEHDIFYNDENDELFLNVFNGFDVAIFNICSLLGIGRIRLDSYVPYEENGFAPVHDKVSLIKFTLEEFKQLDGFVAWFKFTRHFIYFKGLLMGANYIHENVQDGDDVPDFKSSDLLRGEKLFLMD